jgi:hypothetical protein
MTQDRGIVLAGLALGAGLMYLLDPDGGRRRRARLRDRLNHLMRTGGGALGATGRDVAHRTTGAAARLRSMLHHEDVDDEILVERVRAQLGRAVSHPRAIRVLAQDGVVTLEGPVLAVETARLLRAVERVRGVREVISQLDEHDQGSNIPALQGSGARSAAESCASWQSQWPPALRLLAGTTGFVLTGYGAARRGTPGALMAAAGLGLIARSTVGREALRTAREAFASQRNDG